MTLAPVCASARKSGSTVELDGVGRLSEPAVLSRLPGWTPCPCVRAVRRANANATNPFLQARHGTVVQLAVFEAVARKYSQLDAIAGDVDDARVLGGIHWRYDQVGGNALGRAVAAEVVKNRLRAVHP